MSRKTLLAATALAAMATSIAVPVVAAAPPVRARIVDGTLRITGSPFADRIALRLAAADATQLQLDLGDDGSADASFDVSTFAAIDVDAGGGDDLVRLDTGNGAFTAAKPTRVFGGRGDDTLLGGSGNETFFGGRGNDVIDGNGGADTAFLGPGDDTFVWDPGDGSDVVEGDSGFDTLVFNGSGGNELMAAGANGGRVTFTRTPGNVVMDLESIEGLDVHPLGGTDSIAVGDLSGTDLSHVELDLAGALGGTTGDRAADRLGVNGTAGDDTIAVTASGGAVTVSGLAATVRITHADADLDSLGIGTGGGNDHVSVDPAVNGSIGVTVD